MPRFECRWVAKRKDEKVEKLAWEEFSFARSQVEKGFNLELLNKRRIKKLCFAVEIKFHRPAIILHEIQNIYKIAAFNDFKIKNHHLFKRLENN